MAATAGRGRGLGMLHSTGRANTSVVVLLSTLTGYSPPGTASTGKVFLPPPLRPC